MGRQDEGKPADASARRGAAPGQARPRRRGWNGWQRWHARVAQAATWLSCIAGLALPALADGGAQASGQVTWFAVAPGSHPHDVAPLPEADGPVYFTAQHSGRLGILDPKSGQVTWVPLGAHSAPHGVIAGPDRAAWITDGGQNAILRVDPTTHAVASWPLPDPDGWANLNTLTFDRQGHLWFTGQAGIYGRLEPGSGQLSIWRAPRGPGAYGMTTTPRGEVYYASLAGNHIAHIDLASGSAAVLEPPTAGQGARRIWSDSRGALWVSCWNTGQVDRYEPASGNWREWRLPGVAHAYAVWVDAHDQVWLTDWSANAIVRFDPASGQFTSFPSDREQANVRQLGGRDGEVWGAESGTDRLVRIRTGS